MVSQGNDEDPDAQANGLLVLTLSGSRIQAMTRFTSSVLLMAGHCRVCFVCQACLLDIPIMLDIVSRESV